MQNRYNLCTHCILEVGKNITMKRSMFVFVLLSFAFLLSNCKKGEDNNQEEYIAGFELLSDLSGHWVGSNETAFGNFDWFAFDFRPISASHLHSIYEGSTNQNIITSVFLAEFEGKLQVMARNGGWLGNQYRATYFVVDSSMVNPARHYYRLVDAVGRKDRAYMEFRFQNDTLYFDAYKDNSGSLDQPIHHMGFRGTNFNPTFAQSATDIFSYPQRVAEVNFENQFVDLIDPDSALFLEESIDPFPRADHGHLSELNINIIRGDLIPEETLLLYLSKEPIIDADGSVNFESVQRQVIRTISVLPDEQVYRTTYLHPDQYYVTAFSDLDANFFPSSGDVCNISKLVDVTPESELSVGVEVNLLID